MERRLDVLLRDNPNPSPGVAEIWAERLGNGATSAQILAYAFSWGSSISGRSNGEETVSPPSLRYRYTWSYRLTNSCSRTHRTIVGPIHYSKPHPTHSSTQMNTQLVLCQLCTPLLKSLRTSQHLTPTRVKQLPSVCCFIAAAARAHSVHRRAAHAPYDDCQMESTLTVTHESGMSVARQRDLATAFGEALERQSTKNDYDVVPKTFEALGRWIQSTEVASFAGDIATGNYAAFGLSFCHYS